MIKYRRKDTINAVQFLFIDNIDGKETIKFAESLGLSRNGNGMISKIWEVKTKWGWKIVNHGDYVIIDDDGSYAVVTKERFEELYERAT